MEVKDDEIIIDVHSETSWEKVCAIIASSSSSAQIFSINNSREYHDA